jgi:hypothetical protein
VTDQVDPYPPILVGHRGGNSHHDLDPILNSKEGKKGNKGKNKEGYIGSKDIAKIGRKPARRKGLRKGHLARSGQNIGHSWPKQLFAKGPIRLDQVRRVAKQGAPALVVWLALRALADRSNGAWATVTEVVEQAGLPGRTVRRAVGRLERIGMVRRHGRELEVPDYAR